MSIFSCFAVPALLAGVLSLPARGQEFSLLSRFILDIAKPDGKETNYSYDLPNLAGTLKTADGLVVAGRGQISNLNPDRIGDSAGLRLHSLTASKGFSTGGKHASNVTAGLFSPDFMEKHSFQMAQAFPLPGLDRQFPTHGGLTGLFAEHSYAWTDKISLTAGTGPVWKIAAINRRFGDENGPGYTSTPSFIGRGDVRIDAFKLGYQFVSLAKGGNGREQDTHYAFGSFEGKLAEPLTLKFLADARRTDGNLTLSAFGNADMSVTGSTTVRMGTGSRRDLASWPRPRIDFGFIQALPYGFKAMAGASRNFEQGQRDMIWSVGLSHKR